MRWESKDAMVEKTLWPCSAGAVDVVVGVGPAVVGSGSRIGMATGIGVGVGRDVGGMSRCGLDPTANENVTPARSSRVLAPWADARASELSTGTRRICDLAAQVAAEPKLILLDEPTAGVAQREAEAFGPLLRQIRDELDCSVLIVEHDMPLLMGLCDRIYAMEAGQVIAEGTPDEIRNDPRVVASYLGTKDAAITRSGVKEFARRD